MAEENTGADVQPTSPAVQDTGLNQEVAQESPEKTSQEAAQEAEDRAKFQDSSFMSREEEQESLKRQISNRVRNEEEKTNIPWGVILLGVTSIIVPSLAMLGSNMSVIASSAHLIGIFKIIFKNKDFTLPKHKYEPSKANPTLTVRSPSPSITVKEDSPTITIKENIAESLRAPAEPLGEVGSNDEQLRSFYTVYSKILAKSEGERDNLSRQFYAAISETIQPEDRVTRALVDKIFKINSLETLQTFLSEVSAEDSAKIVEIAGSDKVRQFVTSELTGGVTGISKEGQELIDKLRYSSSIVGTQAPTRVTNLPGIANGPVQSSPTISG